MYYNEIVKFKFLDTLKTSQQNRYKRLFKTIGSIEQKRDKDVAEQNIEEILSLLQQSVFLFYAEDDAMKGCVGLIVRYKKWYSETIKKDIPLFERDEFPVDEIDLPENYPLKFFKDGKELLSFLQQIFPDSESTRNFTLNLTYLLIFNGINIEEIAQIKREQVDFKSKTITVNEFPIRMIPEFESYYLQAIQLLNLVGVEKNGKVRILPVNTKYFFPMSGEKRTWKNNFSFESQQQIADNQDWFTSNRKQNKISVLDIKVLAINGILYRTYLELIRKEGGYLSTKDKKSKSINKFFKKYYQVFYEQ